MCSGQGRHEQGVLERWATEPLFDGAGLVVRCCCILGNGSHEGERFWEEILAGKQIEVFFPQEVVIIGRGVTEALRVKGGNFRPGFVGDPPLPHALQEEGEVF